MPKTQQHQIVDPHLPAAEFSGLLLHWFERHGRKDLPWQQEPSSYRVWVSEIMLQQTQVSTVIPYYLRFIQRFADLPTLAQAPLDEVLHLWSGLGYYARARNLHAAAQQACVSHAGRLPEQLDALIGLPGIGRSTAGAILSLAHGQRQPILDGNVKRVLSRCFAVAGWPGRVAVERQLWALADYLLPGTAVGAYNQALMDLGAGCCSRRTPRCNACPLKSVCRAFAEGTVEHYPAPKPRKSLPVKRCVMLLVYDAAGHLLLEQRPPAGLWGGLWCLPQFADESSARQWCGQWLGLAELRTIAWPQRRHTFSHYHLEITPLAVEVKNRANCVMDGAQRVWYNTGDPEARGLAAPVSRLIGELTQYLTGDDG